MVKQKRAGVVNILVIVLLVAAIIGVVIASQVVERRVVPNAGKLVTEEPASTETTEPGAEASEESAAAQGPAKAYLLVTVAGMVYEPIPLYEAGRYSIRRGDYENIIEVTEDSIRMAESNCANQDCVEQGVVSLDNRDDRVLRNMVICLPNDVALELYTYEEILEIMQGYAEELAE